MEIKINDKGFIIFSEKEIIKNVIPFKIQKLEMELKKIKKEIKKLKKWQEEESQKD